MRNFVVSGCHFYGNGQNLNKLETATITGSVFQNGEKKDDWVCEECCHCEQHWLVKIKGGIINNNNTLVIKI